MAKLDKSRPYGEVSGTLDDGTRYFQDDKRFDAHGNEVGEPKKAKARKVEPFVDVDKQIEQQLKGV